MADIPHPHDDPHYKAMEALNFYAYATSADRLRDNGGIARQTLDEIREQTVGSEAGEVLHARAGRVDPAEAPRLQARVL